MAENKCNCNVPTASVMCLVLPTFTSRGCINGKEMLPKLQRKKRTQLNKTKELKRDARVIMSLNLATGPACGAVCIEVNGQCMEKYT